MPYRSIFFLFFSFFFVILKGQEVRVSDNKGTLQTVTSNRVTTSAAAPTTPVEGDVWFDTSTNLSKIYDGAIWKTIDEDKVSTSAAAPTTLVEGDVWFDTTNNISKIYDGSVWKAIQSTAKSIWDDDNDTGIQIEESADEDKIRFDTGGSERMIIDETGDVGIGTTTPNSQLHVSGGPVKIETTGGNSASTYATRQAVLTFNRDDIPTSWTNKITTSFSGTAIEHTLNFELATGQNTDTTVMTLNALGNVGIGTTAPTQRLDVNGSARVRTLDAGIVGTDEIVVADANGVLKKVAASNLNNDWKILGNSGTTAGSNFVGTTDSQDLVFKTNNVEAARFKSAEQRLVFANTGDFATPGVSTSAVLGIEGTTHGRLRLTAGSQETYNDSEGASIELHGNTSTANTGVLDLVAGQAASGTDAAIKLWTNSIGAAGGQATRMVVTGNGDVGIGTTAPSQRLDVDGQARVRTLNAGVAADEIVVTDATGVLKKRSLTDVVQEPWHTEGTTTGHTANTGNMFFMGDIVVGQNTTTAGKVATFAGDVDIQGVLDPTKIIMSGDGTIGSFNPTTDGQYEIEFQEGRDLEIKSNTTDNIVHMENAGDVGIGTGNPDAKLEVSTAGETKVRITAGAENQDAILEFNNSIGQDPTAANYAVKNAIVSDGLGTWKRADMRFVLNNEANNNEYSIANDTRMIIKPSGNVGINTTNPTNLLHINTTSTATDNWLLKLESNPSTAGRKNVGMLFTADDGGGGAYNMAKISAGFLGSNSWNDARLYLGAGNGAPTRMTIRGNGNVGIGTTTPTERLHVEGGIILWNNGVHRIEHTTPGGETGLVFNADNASNRSRFDIRNVDNGTVGNRYFGLTYNGETGLFIRKGGNVGIGTTAPTQRLDVNGTGVFRNGQASNDYTGDQIQFSYNGGSLYKNAIRSRHHGSNDLNNALDFYTWDAGTNATGDSPTLHGMTIAGGRVGISNTTPSTFLHILNTSAMSGTYTGVGSILRLQRQGTGGSKYTTNAQFSLGTYEGVISARTRLDIQLGHGNTNGVDRTPMTILSAGLVGINNNNAPTYNMDVNGTFKNNNAGLFSVMGGNDDDVPNTTAGGHPKRGIFMWDDSDPNWGIYMSRSGAGRALDGGTATAGVGFNSHAIRFRVNNTTTQGFIFENVADQNLFSIRGSDGFAYFRGNMRIDGLPTNTGTNSDDIVVADADGNLKTTNVGVSEISYADRNYTFIPKNAQGGIAMIKAHTWVDEHWFGLLTWRNNGTGSSTIVSAVLTQLSQSGNLTPSVTTSGTGIVFSWTGQHTNPHGWTFTIIE